MLSACPDYTLCVELNLVEPPWYGPVCPVVWEGRRREASPYPDPWHVATVLALQQLRPLSGVNQTCLGHRRTGKS